MKWVDKHENKKNTYVNYIWRIQGIFKNLNKLWRANPLLLDLIEASPMHLDEDKNIIFDDVIKLYNKLSPKYKMVLKIMMYTGLNPTDLVKLKPVDFLKIKNIKKYGNKLYFYVNKLRVKSKGKQVKYLQVYTEEFMKEIKAYFETEKTLKYNKTNQAKKVEQLKNDSRFEVVKEYINFIEFKGKRNWNNDKKENIFGNIKSTAVSDAFSYHNGGDAIVKVMPSTIRRLSFSRLASAFTQGIEDTDLFNLWTQHKVGVITESYMTLLISNTIKKLKNNMIQEAVYIEKMTKYVKETIELREKIGEIKEIKEDIHELNKLTVENEKLKRKIASMEAKHEEEIKDINLKVGSISSEMNYFIDLMKAGKVKQEEARAGITRKEAMRDYPSAFSKKSK